MSGYPCRHHVDARIDHDHNGEWQIESDDSGIELVANGLADYAETLRNGAKERSSMVVYR